jgi:GDP/UDP-N,N'-diacetylbacillosamine 2-epimerase (hydrolysing)
MRKICIFTSTRAEWGLLKGVAEQICQSDALQLQLLVSGSHLSEQHGMTVREIETDGFAVDARVNILKFDDSSLGVCRSMGLAMSGSGEALEQLRPDVLVVLGDRYETFCATAAAQILRIPIAHIHGGETTEGAVDEAFRHSITKMAHLHFPCCDEYRRRIIQLGENPARAFNVGALGIENIRKISLMSRAELEESIRFKLNKPFFLVTFHPVTLEHETAGAQFKELLDALDQFPEHKIIFTKANADTDGAVINEMIDEVAASHAARCLAVASLGLRRYLSAMSLCDAVVGNSSSGILETPVFGIPTVNIGDRQKGRLRTPSIIDCEPDCESIVAAIQKALNPQYKESLKGIKHPCEKAETARAIVHVLETVQLDDLLKKSFYDFPDSRSANEI